MELIQLLPNTLKRRIKLLVWEKNILKPAMVTQYVNILPTLKNCRITLYSSLIVPQKTEFKKVLSFLITKLSTAYINMELDVTKYIFSSVFTQFYINALFNVGYQPFSLHKVRNSMIPIQHS